MGLDMYAARRLSVTNWDHLPAEQRYSVTVTRGGKPVPGYEKDIDAVEREVMYWRKANAIHRWFVENVQNGKDDCGRYYVPLKDLKRLREACQKVIEASELVDGQIYAGTQYDKENPQGKAIREPGKVIRDESVAIQTLPTLNGFFYGSTEYDQDYLSDLVQTRDWIDRMIDDDAKGIRGDIYYSSSW